MEQLDMAALFLLGFLGTGHCMGMCGPLVFALPGRTGRFMPHLAYHAGRLGTYTLIGLAMGGLGSGLALAFSETGSRSYLSLLAGIQVSLSVLAGLFLIAFGLAQLGLIREPGLLAIAAPEKIPGYRRILRSAYAGGGNLNMLLAGLILGFLPCGLSFAAFSKALAAASPVKGALGLLAFGLGTLPGLLLMGSGVSQIARRYRRQSDILSGLVMLGMGLTLLAKATKIFI